jgi:uncharacterized protein (DUF1330 family)
MLYLTVKLYGKNGINGEFKDYESKALKLFRQHGGEVVVAYVPIRTPGTENTPDEIQILRIENQASFEKFLNDPERLNLSAERDRVIRKTEIYISEKIVHYSE